MSPGPLQRASEAVRDSRTVGALARLGLVARTCFYLLLAYLVVRVLLADHGPQANTSGALQTVASTPLGRAPVAVAAAGFLAFGVSRLLGAVRDREADTLSRITTGLQGLFYLGLTEVPAAYVFGSRATGSEQQGRSTTARLLGLPAGRELVIAAGLVVIGVSTWQVVTAVRTGFTGSLHTERAKPWVGVLVRTTGRVGITMRALAFVPLGVFLIVAASYNNPNQAKGMDAAFSALARNAWGRFLLGVIAAGFVVFATYSLLEARYRDVDAGD